MFLSGLGLALKWVDPSFEFVMCRVHISPPVWLMWVTFTRLSSVSLADVATERHIMLWPLPFLSFPLLCSQIIVAVEAVVSAADCVSEHTCEHTCTVMSRRASAFTALSIAQTVQCVQGCTSVLEGSQKVTTVIEGCFAGRTCKNRCKGCTWPPKLLCNFYSLYIVYKCGRGPRVTSWRGEVSTPLLCILYGVEW
jgi:hypothetical protein